MNKFNFKDVVCLKFDAENGKLRPFEILGILETYEGDKLYTKKSVETDFYVAVYKEEDLLNKEEAIKVIQDYYDNLKVQELENVM